VPIVVQPIPQPPTATPPPTASPTKPPTETPTPAATATPQPTPTPEAPTSFLGGIAASARSAWTAVVGFVSGLWQSTDSWINPTPAPTSTALPPTPTEAPISTPVLLTATPLPAQRLVIANTAGEGAYLRRDPSRGRTGGNLIRLWPDGTVLTPTGEATRADEWEWYKVKDPAGNVGWMPKQYVREGP